MGALIDSTIPAPNSPFQLTLNPSPKMGRVTPENARVIKRIESHYSQYKI